MHIRWTCWQEKVIGWDKYNEMFSELINTHHSLDAAVNAMHQKCAEILKKFVVEEFDEKVLLNLMNDS